MSNKNTPFLFLIFTTPGRVAKANRLYHLLNKRIHLITLYIIIPDDTLTNLYERNQHEIRIKASSFYEDLSRTTLTMFHIIHQLFPEIKGVFKCNDNILPNISTIQKTIKNINQRIAQEQPIDYAGVLCKTHSHKKFRYTEHHGLCSDTQNNNRLVELPRNVIYANHNFYYLSQKALLSLVNSSKTIHEWFYDDVMIAHHLAITNQIFPHSLELFHSNINRVFQTSILNSIVDGKETYKTLYVVLQGNLGERMFQTAAAYGLAKMHHMYLIFVDNSPYDVFHRIFLKEFPCIDISNLDSNILEDAYPILEINHKTHLYQENLIPESVLATNRDVFIQGYFKNENYFKHCAYDIYSLFHSPLSIAQKIFLKKGISSGFQAVRRYSTSSIESGSCFDGSQNLRGGSTCGSYGSNEPSEQEVPTLDKSFFIYVSETQSNMFLSKAISYIREYEWKPYFYVLSHWDDEQTLANFECLNSVEKTIITIRSVYNQNSSDKSECSELTTQSTLSDNNLIDALAIMSLCKRGGIVSYHDPISWWGAFLNDNIRKIIVYNIQSISTRQGVFVKGLPTSEWFGL